MVHERGYAAADAPGQGLAPDEHELAPSAELGAFSARIDELRTRAGDNPRDDLLEALGELDVAQEELRVADEELRTQRDQIELMLSQHRDELISRERVASLLPMAILVTTLEGMVLEANAAAGMVLHRPLRHMLRKPLASFVAPEDRPPFRRAVSRLGTGADVERLTLGIVPTHGDALEANVVGIPETRRYGVRVLRWVVMPSRVGAAEIPGEVRAAHDLETATAFAEMCRIPLLSDDRQVLLRRLSEVVGRGLPEAGAVSITLGSPEEPEWIGTDSVLAQQVDGAQMSAGEGPCDEAFRTREIVVTDDTAADDRWPAFSREAEESKVRSVLAVPVSAGDDCLGVLNIYAAEPGAFGRRSRQVGELFGAAVSAVLQEVTNRGSLSDLAAQLEQAMQSRAVIDQAKGMIMAKYGGTPDDAFRRLATLSQHTNTKVRDIARMLVEQAASIRRG